MDLSLTLAYLLLRILIPLTLAAASILRQNLFSSLYLILLLIAPHLPNPKPENVLKGANCIYLRVIIVICSIINSAHIIFQIVLVTLGNYVHSFDYCSPIGQVYNLIGLHRYNDLSVLNILRLVCLDLMVLLVTCLVYAFCIRVYTAKQTTESSRENLTRSDTRRERRPTEPCQSTSDTVVARLSERQVQLSKKRLKKAKAERLTYYFCEAIFFTLLGVSAILEASLTSSVYFFYFLFIGSWFAMNRNFGMGYHYFRIFIVLFVALHYCFLYAYQFLIFRPLLPPDNINARLFGLIDYTNSTCSNVRELQFYPYHFTRFVHPFVLLLLYFVSVSLVRSVLVAKKYIGSHIVGRRYRGDTVEEPLLPQGPRGVEENRVLVSQSMHMNRTFDRNATDNTPLLHSDRVGRTYNSVSKEPGPSHGAEESGPKFGSFSNPHSSLSMGTTSIPHTPNQLTSSHARESKVSIFLSQVVNVIKRGSYVITLIVMMAWSITYHSWLSFVLLLASCIIWMMPNSRRACLNSSPILVLYAILLLIGQYVYSLNLTDSELPVTASGVAISEIGFRKYGQFSYQPLFVKIVYTMFFWVTLRQYSERKSGEETADETSQGLFAPLFSIGTRRSSRTQTELNRELSLGTTGPTYQSKVFESMINFFHEVLIKYWIWVVAIMLMVMSLSGSKVVIYRIVYMLLFLTFTLLFQISLKWWRKFIYPFWLIVILYSMLILIAIYTYQFNNFPDYWQTYLKIDKELQEDLGLVVYNHDAFILFKELLTPTFFIIITIIQVHFLHKDFLEFSNIDDILERLQNPNNEHTSSTSEQPITSGSFDQSDVRLDIDLKSQPSQSESSIQTVISKRPTITTTDMAHKGNESRDSQCANLNESKKLTFVEEMRIVMSKCCSHIKSLIMRWMVVFWRLLEIHVLKVVLICTVVISIKDISAMNVLFVFLTVILMAFNKFERIVCIMFSTWAGILVLLKMLFQLNIAQRIEWHTNCTNNPDNATIIDNRTYVGFLKTDDIFQYIWEYILLIVVLVFRSVITLRQTINRRQEYGTSVLPEGVVFLNVNRLSAEKGFKDFLKYILNFGFYKFGVEMSLILLTISIGNRGDIFSVLYSIWLLMFVFFNRHECQQYWLYFVIFMTFVVPYQYMMCLGIPPGLCLLYPWSNQMIPSDIEWYFLPDFKHNLPKEKIYLDFLILFFSCRQLVYFRLEPTFSPIAGSNIEAHKEITSLEVPDFFSFGKSIFDTMKQYLFLCFFWVTLAVLFLAGTMRNNLLGLGYVLGSFIFLWNGNEFYLKPIKLIFKSWKSILAYTCFSMLIKSLMQLFVVTMLNNDLCWLVQLLGISYTQKAELDKNARVIFEQNSCPVEEAGLFWDGICFTFLLIQKRIFCSHYFKHLIREVKAQHFLASRGAELIHEIQAQEVSEQAMAEREVMEKIKQKMDRIKEAQRKMFANKARSIKTHKQAVKSGGYYMFEDQEAEMVELNARTRESLIPDPEGKEMHNLAKSKGFTAFCSKIFKGEEMSEAALVSAETTDIGESSRDSPIVSVERIKLHPDMSRPTSMTTVPSTSQATDISNMSSLASQEGSKALVVSSKTEKEHPESHGEGEEECKDQSEKQETYMKKFKGWLDFIKAFLESILISATSSFNSVSRDYRFVAQRLTIEKKCLKRIIEAKELDGVTYDFISDLNWRKVTLAKLSKSTQQELEEMVTYNPEELKDSWDALDATSIEGNKNLYLVSLNPNFLETSIYRHFFQAIFYAVLSRSEVICYITIVINQLNSASILSMPLPLLAFLWGSLSVPRPSKSFWVTCITYIEVVVVIKYIFQFQFWSWIRTNQLSPFWWPRILGIEKNYGFYDLLLLLVLFFHRFMLKGLGLWDLSETEIKAYMTNAELAQQCEDSGDHEEKNKSQKKKSKKSKAKQSSVKSTEMPDDTVNENSQSSQEPPYEEEFFENEENDNEFNIIYFLMETPNKIKTRFFKIVKPIIKFFHNVLHPPYRITHDVYSLMFLCDFINFFILVFGFYAFGSGYSGSEDVARFLEENKIPIGFLITLLLQFAQIIIDRAIYLRKYIKGKLIFQIIIVVFTHLWLFFVLPLMTEKSFTDKSNLPPKLWYIFKCIYFLLSAYQIRSGYPTRILGNTFCKKYNFVNWYLFKIYMIIPFVYDLRMYMDWIWTDTSLVLDEWSLMEDIFVNLYQRKCELKLDEEFPEPRGKAKKRFFKYLIGGSWVIIIIALIWGPLGLFAFGRAVGEVNTPVGAAFDLEIGGFQPLFKMSVTGNGLEPINDQNWNLLLKAHNNEPVAQTFISGYDQKDVYIVNLNGNSTAVWGISPPSQEILHNELESTKVLNMKITYYIVRNKTKTQDTDATIYDEYSIELDPIRDSELRKKLSEMILNRNQQSPVIVPHIFPNYLRAPEKGKPTVVDKLLPKPKQGNRTMNYRNIKLQLKKGKFGDGSNTSWWEIYNDNLSDVDDFFNGMCENEKCRFLPVVVFNDKVFIGLLAFLSGYGIMGIYTTFVFLVSRWVRGLNSESSFKVIYTRMPNVDRVLQLCLDIYLVRESREFELEEDLYAKLIFLYRSPETLIKWTKILEEIPDQTNRNVYRSN